MKSTKNPFLLTGYIGPEYFCDREKELAVMQNNIANDRNMVLFSWRRLGKSALIKRYLKEAEKQGEIEALYVDLMATNNLQKAIETIIEAVYLKYGKTSSGMSAAFQKLIGGLGLSLQFDAMTGVPSFSIQANNSNGNADNLNTIGQFLSKRKSKVVIAIDEFQQITRYKEDSAEAVFRQFMQNFPTIQFIFSGSHRQMMSSMFMESTRPFYKSCQLLSLGPIPIELYSPFIQNHFKQIKKTISEEIIASIYEWSRGQTYCIQLICNRFYGSNIPINEEGLEQIKKELLDQEAPIFGNYYNLLTNAQWDITHAIAKAGTVKNPLSKKFISTYNLGAVSTVNSALKNMMEKELIVKEDSNYFVHDVIFSRWLERI
jgi:AAA+ ATPase superfamily predicted ATPase